jgi:hypothetical protein
MKYRGSSTTLVKPKPQPAYVTREFLDEFAKATGEALGEQFRALQDRIDQLESEIALVRALSKTREDA